MQFFFYCRDKAGAGETRRGLLKQHWAFMRHYVAAMIARGPTMSADGKAVTGSMHVVDLPGAQAANVFAHDDPLAKGGVFEDIMVRPFQNMLGRTMWQFAGDATNPRFLFIGEAAPGASAQGHELLDAQSAYFGDTRHGQQIIVFGPLLGADEKTWEGTVVLLEARDERRAEELLAGDPALKLCARTKLHRWRFGGEENLQDLIAHI